MVSSRIKRIFEKLRKQEYKLIGTIKENKFTRDRKMSFFELVTCILSKKGKTLTLELREYMKKNNKEEITKQAFSKQRQNLNPEIFKVLNKEYVEDIYKEREVKYYNGYKLWAVDGTMLELPNSEELKEYYGLQLGQKGSVGRVRARGMGIYDVLNDIMVNTRIDPYNISEKVQIEAEIKKMKGQKVILICDRFYFGISFINKLDKLGIKYVIRMRNEFYKKEKEEMNCNDEIVDLKIRTNSVFYAEDEEEKEELRKLKSVKTRIIKIRLETNEEEHLATNLSKEELAYEEAGELYFKRWGIEKAYDRIKNKLNIENFSSKKVIGIEQEFYASMLLYNMIEDLRIDAGERIVQDKTKKYEYKINTNIMVGIFKEEFIEIFTQEDSELIDNYYEKLIEEINKYLIPIKPGRKYPRKKMHSMNKYRSNLRRNT